MLKGFGPFQGTKGPVCKGLKRGFGKPGRCPFAVRNLLVRGIGLWRAQGPTGPKGQGPKGQRGQGPKAKGPKAKGQGPEALALEPSPEPRVRPGGPGPGPEPTRARTQDTTTKLTRHIDRSGEYGIAEKR